MIRQENPYKQSDGSLVRHKRYDGDSSAYEWDLDGRRLKKFSAMKSDSVKQSESVPSENQEAYCTLVELYDPPHKVERRDNKDSKDYLQVRRIVMDSP